MADAGDRAAAIFILAKREHSGRKLVGDFVGHDRRERWAPPAAANTTSCQFVSCSKWRPPKTSDRVRRCVPPSTAAPAAEFISHFTDLAFRGRRNSALSFGRHEHLVSMGASNPPASRRTKHSAGHLLLRRRRRARASHSSRQNSCREVRMGAATVAASRSRRAAGAAS
jgi:hypothetical protein